MEQVNVRWYVEDVSAHSASVVIAGLPGVGHVGKLVVDHLVRALSAVKVAEITSTLFPPQMYLDCDAVLRLPRNEIFFVPGTDEHDPVLFLAGDCQSTSAEGHYTLAEGYLRVFDLLGVRRIYTLGGYGVGRMVEHPRVLSALSSASLKEEVLAAGAVINPEEPVGGIIGAARDGRNCASWRDLRLLGRPSELNSSTGCTGATNTHSCRPDGTDGSC